MRRIAYIATHYPAISHTFVARELEGLRGLGIDVRTFSGERAAATSTPTWAAPARP